MMHFFKSKKFIIMIVSAIMMTSLGITANAESLLDQTLTYDSNKSAFLNYDPENDTYELLTEDGDDISDYVYDETPDETQAAVTTPAVTTRYISPATTVPPYIGRLRAEILSERALLTKATTVKTTVKMTALTFPGIREV